MLAFSRICETLPSKILARQGADRESDGLPLVDRADVRLVDRRPDLQAAQVLGDQEEARGIQAGDDGLADVDAAVEDDALDRRADRRVSEVDGGLLEIGPGDGQRALADGQGGLGRLVVRQAVVVFLLGDDGRPSGLELLVRSSSRLACRSLAWACSMSASALATWPRAWSTRAWNSALSSRASTVPCSTCEP